VTSEKFASVLFRTGRNFTARWTCQRGDYLLWLSRGNPLQRREEPLVADVWSICDEALVTITNRWQDFPPWFDLHPLEVSGQFIPWMKQRMEARDYPEEPIDGPNIWRVKGGDRVVWVGLPRSEQTSVDGVLGIVDCRAAVVVLGEIAMSARRQGAILDELFPFMHFEQSPQAMALCTAGLKAEQSLGLPPVYDSEWRLG
jgi:hypothetical protein